MFRKGTLAGILLLAICFFFLPFRGVSQVGYVWGKVIPSPTYGDAGLDAECDQKGNIFSCGDYKDNATIGGTLFPSFGGTDIYLSKQAPDGQYDWATVKGSPTTDRQFAVSLGPADHSYTTGYGLIIFPFSRSTQHQWDALTIRYRPDGNLAWGRAMDGDVYSEGRDISVDDDGNSYTVGFLKTLGWWDTDTLFGHGLEDAFIVKFDSTGGFQWAHAFGGTMDDEALSVDVDPQGNVWVGGYFQGTANFGSTVLSSGGGKDAFVAKLDPNGNIIFVKQFSGAGDAEVYRLKFSEDGDCYFAGNFDGNIILGSQNYNAIDLTDIFYGKMDGAGNMIWTKVAGGLDLDAVQDIAIDDEENIYFGGYFFGGITWQSSSIQSTGFDDAFFAKADSNGNLLFLEGSYYASESRGIFGVAVDPAQNMILTGRYAQRIEFGTDTFYSQSNSSDAFIAKYATRNQAVEIQNVDGTPYCVGDNFQVKFKAYGNFESGNVFQLELSDASGSFASPSIIGTFPSVFGGVLTGTIPGSITAGTGYRVRITSTLPQITSTDNGYDITLSPTTAIPVQIMGDTVLCNGQPSLMSIDQGLSSQIWSTGDTSYYTLVSQVGLLWVEATDANGCSNRDEVMMTPCVAIDAVPQPAIALYPNPSQAGSTFLQLENIEHGTYTLQIIDLSGKVLSNEGILVDHQINTFSLATSNLPAGVYVLQISGKGIAYSRKLMLE